MCQPGKYGADLIVYSTTKFLSTRNAVGGAVVDTETLNGIKAEIFKVNKPTPHTMILIFMKLLVIMHLLIIDACVMRDLGRQWLLNAYLT